MKQGSHPGPMVMRHELDQNFTTARYIVELYDKDDLPSRARERP